MRTATIVHHWRFEDGVTIPNPGSPFPLDPPPRGWYCWTYPNDNQEFLEWMNQNCPTADVTHRFNSGNPMFTVYITSDAEATLFSLKYGTD